MRAPERHVSQKQPLVEGDARTVFGLDERRHAPAERHPALDDSLDSRRDEVDAAQLRQVYREHNIEDVALQRRELSRVHRAQNLRRRMHSSTSFGKYTRDTRVLTVLSMLLQCA